MKKFLLLLCTLLMGVSSAWADVTVTVAGSSGSQPYAYGTRSNSNKTFTTNDASGLSGVVLNVTGSIDGYSQGTYGGRIALKTAAASTDETWTLTAPNGYLITGYSFSAVAAGSYTATITAGGNNYNISNSGYTNVSVTSLKAKTTSFTVNASAANWLAVGPFTVTLKPIDFVSLTFDRSSSATNSVTVNVKDSEGDAIPGVTASLVETSITEFKTGSATALSRTTNSVLAPNAGYDNQQNSTITYTFKVDGLAGVSYNKAALDVYALTGGGASQGNTGSTVREWTFDVETGSATNALESFVSQSNNDICTVEDEDDGLYHKLWTMSGDRETATDALYIKVTLTKTASLGCFAGIGKVQLFNVSATIQYEISDAFGVVFTSAASEATIGDVITTLPDEYKRDNCSYDVTEKTIEAGDNIVSVSMSYELFTVSQESDLENATWYFINLNGEEDKYLYSNGTASKFTKGTKDSNSRSDQWAIMGNPYSYFYFMNRNDGAGYYMQCMTPSKMNSSLNARWGRWTMIKNGEGFKMRLPSENYWFADNDNSWVNNNTGDGAAVIYLEAVPNVQTVDVTYELYVGGEKVNTVVDAGVIANSDINIPATLTSAYSALAYDFDTEGTIGDTDCTITVTGTMKTGVVTALNQLSNTKAYTLTTERGSLGTNGTQMVSSYGTAYSASNFAIISYEGDYYLYSIADSKWVGNPTTINTIANQPSLTEDLSSVTPITFDDANATASSPLFYMGMGSNGVNVSNYSTGIVVNSWTTRDEGNQYCIIEADDFDATDALAALDEFFSGPTQFAEAIAQLEAINWGTGLNHYSLTGAAAGYAGNEATIISGLKTQGYSEDNLTTAQGLLANYALNMPSAGFYRIEGNTSNTYLASGLAGNNKFNMTDATDASTIFYYDGTKLTNLGSGMCNGVTSARWAWVVGTDASVVTFQDGLTNGGYAIKSAADAGGTNNANFYDNGDAASDPSADRGGSVTINESTNARYTNWYLTEIETLPVTIGSTTYATLCAPVALTIPSGVNAYYISEVTNTQATMTEIETTIAANTPVILKADAADTYDFVITTGGTDVSATNKLSGQITAQSVAEGVAYTLQQNVAGTAVGLFPKAAGTIAGFKAYLEASQLPAEAEVKGLTFVFDCADGLTEVQGSRFKVQGDEIFNLAGQRLSRMQKGINIIGGKKILVK